MSSTVHTVLAYLQAELAARARLVGVGVFSAPAGDEADFTLETIEFTRITFSDLDLAMRTRMEEFDVEGSVLVVGPGAGETVAQATRERACDLVGEVRSLLADDSTLGGACLRAVLRDGSIEQSYGPEGRGCAYMFTIHVQAAGV